MPNFMYRNGRYFRKVDALRKWLAQCEKNTTKYLGRKVTFWGKVYTCTGVYFTEPGLCPYFELDGYSHNPVPETAWLKWAK